MDKYLGKRIDGRYEIHQLIGMGGMACVYRAFDNQEQRWVAIKILKDEYSGNTEFLKRFRNESRAIAVLSHPNIVKVYDVSFGDRIQYIVMEYIEGITLKDYISHNGALPWKEAVHFVSQILKALQQAHSKGIIHRDIKPQNIMLLKNGTIKVTDFGIARFSQSETQTMTDKALGSVHYIAPEQARGDFTSDKVDIYSVGVMMYEMLTGQLPFEADNAVSVAIMQLQAEPRKPRSLNPQIPVGLEEITMKAMEKNPSMRFQSAGEMLVDIERFKLNPNLTFGYAFQQDFEATRQIDIFEEVKPVSQSRTKPAPVYGDDYEYEVELEKSKKHAAGSMVLTGVITAVIVAALLFGVYFIWNMFSGGQDEVSDQVLLPNFMGMNYDTEVEGNSDYEDFKFVITEGFDPSKDDGIITKQSPSHGIEVKKGKEVSITVNRVALEEEKTPVVLVDLEGESQTDAYNKLQDLGLVPSVESVHNDQTAAGYVIKTEPGAGETVYEGDVVKLIVSKGPSEKQTTVPDIIGFPLYQAEELLKQSKLKVGEITYDEESDEEANTVLEVSPDVGDRVSEDTKIDIKVAKGKKKEKTIPATIPLPAGVNMDLSLKIYVDGELTVSTTVNPYYLGQYNTSFTGKEGSRTVVISLDGQDYITAIVDFEDGDNGSFNIISENPYIPPEPEIPEEPEVPEEPETPQESEVSEDNNGAEE